MPHKVPGQHVNYMFQTPTTAVWRRLHDEGKLTPAQEIFWRVKPAEELYDLATDPDEINNLAGSPEHQETLLRLRGAQQNLARAIRDVGFLPEGEIQARSISSTPYDMGHDEEKYPLERIFRTAELASRSDGNVSGALNDALRDEDSAVRYWGALGMLVRGESAVLACQKPLTAALDDPSPYVRIAAAEALGRYGVPSDRERALKLLAELANWQNNNVFVVMQAFNSIDSAGNLPGWLEEMLGQLPKAGPLPDQRYAEYVPRLLNDL
jgi:uncharacterized sulfatase